VEEAATTPEAREQRRRQTLSALGIEPLISRFDAPYGKASVRFVEPELAQAENLNRDVAIGQAAVEPEKQAVVNPGLDGQEERQDSSSARAGNPAQKPRQATQTESPTIQPKAPHQVDAVAFHLLLVSAGEWLWVESLEDGLLHKEQLALVHNMAIAVSDASADLVHRQFLWPMAEHPHLPRDAVAARQSLGAQLERIGKETPYRGIVLMGEAVSQWVSEELHPKAVVIPSTRQMLQTPTLKRDAWSVLKPLSQVVNAKKGG
jgi:hypothetical protein